MVQTNTFSVALMIVNPVEEELSSFVAYLYAQVKGHMMIPPEMPSSHSLEYATRAILAAIIKQVGLG